MTINQKTNFNSLPLTYLKIKIKLRAQTTMTQLKSSIADQPAHRGVNEQSIR